LNRVVFFDSKFRLYAGFFLIFVLQLTDEKQKKTYMKYTGIIMIVVGALALVFSYLSDRYLGSGTVDYNWVQGIPMLLIIAGLVVHIIMSRKAVK
jgi:hypothetical protein